MKRTSFTRTVLAPMAMLAIGVVVLPLTGCVKDNIKADEDAEAVYDPPVSRDFIVFDRIERGNRYDIFSVRGDGTEYRNRTKTTDINERYPVVTHDSQHMAFVANGTLTSSDIDGQNRNDLPSAAFTAGNFKPQHLSFTGKSNYVTFDDASVDPAVYYAWTELNDKSDEVFLRGFRMPETGEVRYATFSRANNSVCFVRENAGQFSLVVTSNEGYADSTAKVVYTTAARMLTPRFSVDGNHLVFALGAGGGYDICTIDRFGGNFQNLTNGSGDHRSPCFSHDGTRIVTSANRDGNQWDLYIIDTANDNSISNLTNTADANEHNPYWN